PATAARPVIVEICRRQGTTTCNANQVICISDACTTHTPERHENALRAFGGYCRIMTTDEFIKELQGKPTVYFSTVLSTKSELLSSVTRGRSLPTTDLDDYWTSGCGWVPANSALTPQDVIANPNPWGAHGDLRLLPDRSSRVQVTNGPDPSAPALDFIHCDLIETHGAPWDCCPRTLLRNEIERYRNSLGLQITAAFEHEFVLSGRESLSCQPAFSLRAQRQAADFAGWLMVALKAAGVEPEMFLPEFGQSQYEVTCRPTQGIAAADRAVNVREITREIARQIGLHASFSPMPAVNAVSNGVHLHLSIQDLDGRPLLYHDGHRYDLSTLGESWAAGVLRHLPALCALTAPTPVSYLRLKPHHWSAAYACLGLRNREASLRICPTVALGDKSVADQYNLEFRPLDATASPHLSMAAILIAGRLGIEQGLTLEAVTDIDPHELSDVERKTRNINALPSDLSCALEMLSNDDVLLQTLPKPLTETYFALKREELKIIGGLDDASLCERYARLY
ncbi:unnamed protein product, partial [Didymodactylos carnosus]